MDMSSTPSSSRILYDVPCAVCRDHSSGKHYGVYACDGCAGFFKRSVRRQRSYACKAQAPGRCLVDKTHRNQCRACRMDKCLNVGMNKDAVQHERGPRNSTIRRQMSLFMNDSVSPNQMRAPIQPVPEPAKVPLFPVPPSLFFPFLYSYESRNPNDPTPPVPPPSPLTPGLLMPTEAAEMCEAAAKLLFMNVKWVKGIPAFERLPIEDREYLLRQTWRDLFIIGIVQFLFPFDAKVLINWKNICTVVLEDVDLFQRSMAEIASLRPLSTEFTCLRGVLLFMTEHDLIEEEEGAMFHDIHSIAAEQENTKNILEKHVKILHPSERYRTSHLLNLLPIIRRVPGQTIVELFFRPTIGFTSIERIICDMYKTA